MLNDVGDSSQYISTSQYSVKASQNLSFADEQLLLQETEAAIIYFLESGRPVYVSSVGVIFPKVVLASQIKLHPSRFSVLSNKVRIFGFEKCSELIRLHKETYNGVVEIKDIAIRVYKVIAKFLTNEVSLDTIYLFIQRLFSQFRNELIVNGQSYLFKGIGDFFALHNRQGETHRDWFAGADIFISPTYEQTLLNTKTLSFDRPVLCNSLEPFNALYGAPIYTETIRVQDSLKHVGYELSDEDINSVSAPLFTIAVFIDHSAKSLIYVSDGLRSIGIKHPSRQGKGQEFIVQIPYAVAEHFGQNELTKISSQDIPKWPSMFFTIGWILLQSSKSGFCKPGATMSFDEKITLDYGFDNSLTSIMVSRYEKISLEQLVPDGAFEYGTVVAITKDEENVAHKYGIKLLLTLLRYRKYDQLIPFRRQSVTRNSSFVGD